MPRSLAAPLTPAPPPARRSVTSVLAALRIVVATHHARLSSPTCDRAEALAKSEGATPDQIRRAVDRGMRRAPQL